MTNLEHIRSAAADELAILLIKEFLIGACNPCFVEQPKGAITKCHAMFCDKIHKVKQWLQAERSNNNAN